MKDRAVFLDRDGTINVERDYLRRVEDLRLLPGAGRAVRRLNDAGFKVVLITNQSGVARGLLTEEDYVEINRELAKRLRRNAGAKIDADYACFHLPTAKVKKYRLDCDCRKPRPGLFIRAAEDMGLDLVQSFAVGDRRRDIEAAKLVGVTGVLVRTGYGRAEEALEWTEGGGQPDQVCNDLGAAVDWILSR